MARICEGCGGLLGHDCFNELECLQIASQEQSRTHQMVAEMPSLLRRLAKLETILKRAGIDLSELDEPEPIPEPNLCPKCGKAPGTNPTCCDCLPF